MDKKIDDTSGATEATAPSARAHHAGDGGAVAGPARRLSAKRKLVAVQRLMRGESLDAVPRDLNVAVHRLSEWRDRVFMAAENALRGPAATARFWSISRPSSKPRRFPGKATGRYGRGFGIGASGPPAVGYGGSKENNLSAPQRPVQRDAHPHDGTIVTDKVDQVWDEPRRAIGPSDDGE